MSLVAGLMMALLPGPTRAEGPRFLGNFSSMRMSAETGDCGGYSMQLFLKPGHARERVVYGFVRDEESICTRRAMRIIDGRFDTATGRLRFVVDRGDDGAYGSNRQRFAGTWSPHGLRLRYAYFDTRADTWQPWSTMDRLSPARTLELLP